MARPVSTEEVDAIFGFQNRPRYESTGVERSEIDQIRSTYKMLGKVWQRERKGDKVDQFQLEAILQAQDVLGEILDRYDRIEISRL